MTSPHHGADRVEQRPAERNRGHGRPGQYQQWHGWGSPIGLGVGLVCVAGHFVLVALGLAVLASIG